MRKLSIYSLMVSCCLVSGASLANPISHLVPTSQAMEQYIVQLLPQACQSINGQFDDHSLRNFGNRLGHDYGVQGNIDPFVLSDNICGVVIHVTESQADNISKDFIVKTIERDWIITSMDKAQPLSVQDGDYSWALDRINQHSLPLDRNLSFKQDATGPSVTLVDTGVDNNLNEFNGREQDLLNPHATHDSNGVGTAHAGVIGSYTFGVSKNITIFSTIVSYKDFHRPFQPIHVSELLRTLSDIVRNYKDGSVIDINYTAQGKSKILDEQIKLLVEFHQIPVVVQAGDSNQDACNFSPADSPYAITVSATNKYDQPYENANYGKCVDIYAPGAEVKSIWKRNDTQFSDGRRLVSGTGVAASIVSSALAQYEYANDNLTTDKLKKQFLQDASQGYLVGLKPDTPNRLVYLPANSK